MYKMLKNLGKRVRVTKLIANCNLYPKKKKPEKGAPLDHLKRFVGRIGIIITVKIELPKDIFLGLEDKIYEVYKNK